MGRSDIPQLVSSASTLQSLHFSFCFIDRHETPLRPPLMDMASHSRLPHPFSLFLISSLFISSVSNSLVFTFSLKLSQTLTISHSIKSKPFPQIRSSKLLFLQNPNPDSKEQTLAASASNAVTQSPLRLQRLAPPPLSTPLSIATAGVIPCTFH